MLFGFKVLPRLAMLGWLSLGLRAVGAISKLFRRPCTSPDSSAGAVSLRAFAGDMLKEFGAEAGAVAVAALL